MSPEMSASIERMNAAIDRLPVLWNICPCCNGNLLPADKSCDWCRSGACTSLPCRGSRATTSNGPTFAHRPARPSHDAEMAAARDADRVARVRAEEEAS